MKKTLLFVIILIFALAFTAYASEKLSPALDVIATNHSMVKASVTNNNEVLFDVDDFDRPLGVNLKSITITELPSQAVGRLMLDNLYVVKNQVIARDDFSMLKFVQTAEGASAVFKFRPNNSTYEIECSLQALSSVNLCPVASNGDSVSAWTNMNISCFGTLAGYDPEGDKLKYEVVSYPEKGLITITNAETGDYRYTPYENAKGTDAFSYTVRDEFGNYSETCTVKIKIEKLKTSLVFADMDDEKCMNAALVMYEENLMTFKRNGDGTFDFRPNEEITKEEFVSLVMKAMGAKDVPIVEKTRFADDKDIKAEYKGYLESAFSLGIVKGTTEKDGVHINPKSKVTTADAAMIINRIIGAKIETSMTVFADDDQIPDGARESLTSLTELGILEKTNGKISPNSPLTRAQTAQIIMSLLEYRGKLNK